MVDIESAEATSAPVISVRFKLASFLLSKEGERRGQSLVPADYMFFPMRRMPLQAKHCDLPDYPKRPEPTRIAPVELHA